MNKILFYPQNFNGIFCCDAFPFLRPANEDLQHGEEVQIMLDKKFLGYAKIIKTSSYTWSQLNEWIALHATGKNLHWAKTTWARSFGFSDKNPPTPNFPLTYGIAQWLQRYLPEQAHIYTKQWNKAMEIPTPHTQNEASQETLFSLLEHNQ